MKKKSQKLATWYLSWYLQHLRHRLRCERSKSFIRDVRTCNIYSWVFSCNFPTSLYMSKKHSISTPLLNCICRCLSNQSQVTRSHALIRQPRSLSCEDHPAYLILFFPSGDVLSSQLCFLKLFILPCSFCSEYSININTLKNKLIWLIMIKNTYRNHCKIRTIEKKIIMNFLIRCILLFSNCIWINLWAIKLVCCIIRDKGILIKLSDLIQFVSTQNLWLVWRHWYT